MTEYWFARRFALDDARQSMAPVHWKGVLVAVVFVAMMLAGGAAWAWLAVTGKMIAGATVFALLSFTGGFLFIAAARTRGDLTRTVADYRKEKQRV
jgi:cell division protein FtsW (lipid II flippase)